MHSETLNQWQHSHNFASDSDHGENRTTKVMTLTAIMMVIEVVAGMAFGSMALLADGWHMATHVAAFGITLFAYRYARRYAHSPQFTFGTGKVSVLGGFASAVALAVIALVMALESVLRLFEPQAIHFNQAIGVAVVGLFVNLVCGLMLRDHHDHEDGAAKNVRDHNLRAAYLHVLADALTSVFAIVALVAGKYFGWIWFDPMMGLVGAAVISRWSYGLVRETSNILLDSAVDDKIQAAIRRSIEQDADNRVADLHVWHVGPRDYSASLSVVSHHPMAPAHYKQLLCGIPRLAHVLIEVNPCFGAPCMKTPA
jgi:cation diffusion facilitator family transporter